MVAELHVRGYQRLRIVPHLYELGTWRCGITPVSNVRRDHGALACNWDNEVTPQHTSANARKVFGWEDAMSATPSRLASMFIERFPRVSAAGSGPDWQYAGWLSWMLHETYPHRLPIAQGPYVTVPPGGLMTIGDAQIRLQSPPPGECSDPA